MANTKKRKRKRPTLKNKLRNYKKTKTYMAGGEKSEKHTNQPEVDETRDDPENVIRLRRLEEIKEKYQSLKTELCDKQNEKEELNNNFNNVLTDAAKDVAEYKSMSNGEAKDQKLSELQTKYANLNKDKNAHIVRIAKIDEEINSIQEEIKTQLQELTITIVQVLEH